MDCSPAGSPVHWILQARILECIAIPFSRGSSQPRGPTWVSCTAGRFFTFWATREAHKVWEGSDQFSSFVSDSLRPRGLQHARPPCPSPTPRVCSKSCPSSRWCHPTISSSVVPFSSRLQSFPASRSFAISQLFPSAGQSIGVSASASVFPVNIQDWFPLGWTGLIRRSLWTEKGSRIRAKTEVTKLNPERKADGISAGWDGDPWPSPVQLHELYMHSRVDTSADCTCCVVIDSAANIWPESLEVLFLELLMSTHFTEKTISTSRCTFSMFLFGLRLVAKSCPIVAAPWTVAPPGSPVHGDSPGENSGVGCHFLLPGIVPTRESSPRLLHCRQSLYRQSYEGSPDWREPV